MGVELVAETTNRAQVARLGRLALDVTAQADDEIVDGARVGVFVEIPDVVKNRLARDRVATVADEIAEQIGFHQGQLEDLLTRTELKALEVDELAVKLERRRRFRR